MNIVIAHGHAHRLMTNGIVQSAPVRMTDTGLVIEREFEQRNTDDMDITGGDFEFIRELLERLSYIFADGQKRLALTEQQPPQDVAPGISSY